MEGNIVWFLVEVAEPNSKPRLYKTGEFFASAPSIDKLDRKAATLAAHYGSVGAVGTEIRVWRLSDIPLMEAGVGIKLRGAVARLLGEED